MNNVILMGRLTKSPELRYIQNANNTAVARFSIAVDKNLSRDKKQEAESKGQPTADFINILTFGKMAENVVKFTDKGLRVLVSGRIQTGSYEKDGVRIYTFEINADNVQFLDWKDGNNSNTYSPNKYTAPVGDEFEPDFDPTEDSRIPF